MKNKNIFKSFDAEVEKIGGEDERVLRMVGSTEAVDRDREVILSDGWDLKNYKKNPVVLFAHDKWQPAVAKARRVWVEDKKLKFEIEFPPEGHYPFADTLYNLYKGGFMRASSVGFMPKEWVDGDYRNPNEPLRKFVKVELLELSLVPVPANAQALAGDKSLKDAFEADVITSKEWEDIIALGNKAIQCFRSPEEKENAATTEKETTDKGEDNKDFKKEVLAAIAALKSDFKKEIEELKQSVESKSYLETIIRSPRESSEGESTEGGELMDGIKAALRSIEKKEENEE